MKAGRAKYHLARMVIATILRKLKTPASHIFIEALVSANTRTFIFQTGFSPSRSSYAAIFAM
jgi:hypothetical protein